jgi:hypothetical protein
MPLEKGSSEKVIGTNIREMEAAGHPHNQSVAAALHTAHPDKSPKRKTKRENSRSAASKR